MGAADPRHADAQALLGLKGGESAEEARARSWSHACKLSAHESAASAQIRAAYLRCVKATHPDAGAAHGADRFRRVVAAYRTLSDKVRRWPGVTRGELTRDCGVQGTEASAFPSQTRSGAQRAVHRAASLNKRALVFCSSTLFAGCGVFGLAYALHTNFDLYGGKHTSLESPNPSLRAAVARRRSSGTGAAADVA